MTTTTITINLPDGWELAEPEPRWPVAGDAYLDFTAGGDPYVSETFAQSSSIPHYIVRRMMITPPTCVRCEQPMGYGHETPCHRETYDELASHLESVRQISADNANIAVRAIGRLAEIAEIAGNVPPDADYGREWARVLTLASADVLEGETDEQER